MAAGKNTPVGALSAAVSDILYARMTALRSNKSKLSAASGIARTTLGPIIDGKKTFDVEVLDHICQALGLDVEDVLKRAATQTQSRVIDSGIQPIKR
jgi:DNA-binding Xre family transcriptional regulator